jgi:Aldehyde dehydrogenase family
VWVNCFFVRDLRAPFGGAGLSGIGREGGTWSFDFYADVKNTVYAPKGWLSRDAAGAGPNAATSLRRPGAEDPPPTVPPGAPPARPKRGAGRRASGATHREGGKRNG